MGALKSKDIARRLTGSRELIGTAIGKLEGCTGIGAGARTHVPLVGDRHLLREGESHRPTGQCGGAGIGNAHVQLELITTAGLCRRTAVRRKCLPV
jgi:hypothetical protein